MKKIRLTFELMAMLIFFIVSLIGAFLLTSFVVMSFTHTWWMRLIEVVAAIAVAFVLYSQYQLSLDETDKEEETNEFPDID